MNITRVLLSLRRLCDRLRADTRASVAVQFAIAIVPLAGLAGGALDFAFAQRIHAKLQNGLDAAVLAAVKDGTEGWQGVANKVFDGNVSATYTLGASPTFNRDGAGAVTGTIQVAVPTHLLKIAGINSLPVVPVAVASAGKTYDESCILALGQGQPVTSDAITFNGAPNVNLNQCTLRSNTSMRCNGHGGGSVASIAAGTVNGCANPQEEALTVPDIYAPLANNISAMCGGSVGGATWTPGTVPAGVLTVSKVGYTEYHVCGTLTLSGSGFLTGSAPGADSVIIVENGSINMANNASISTKRVAFVLTGNNSYASQINFPNGNGHAATLTLSPPTYQSNPWRGVSLYQNPILTNNVDNDWGPAVTLNPDGVVYLPRSNVVMRGNSGSGLSTCTKFVVNTFQTNGSVDLSYKQTESACASLGVSQPFWTFPYLTE